MTAVGPLSGVIRGCYWGHPPLSPDKFFERLCVVRVAGQVADMPGRR